MTPSERPEAAISQIVENEEARMRIMWLVGQVRAVFPQDYKDVFVSETRDGEGRQIVNAIWLFYDSTVVEIRNPKAEENFNLTPFKTLQWIQVTKQNFDFNISRADDSSRVSVYVAFTDQLHGQIQASRVNCGHLMRITHKWLVPRVAR